MSLFLSREHAADDLICMSDFADGWRLRDVAAFLVLVVVGMIAGLFGFGAFRDDKPR